jgi:hypothetical protein
MEDSTADDDMEDVIQKVDPFDGIKPSIRYEPIDPDEVISRIFEKFTDSQQTAMISGFESKLDDLKMSLGKERIDEDEFLTERAKLRKQLVFDMVSAILFPDGPDYEAMFITELKNAFDIEKGAATALSVFQALMEDDYRKNGIPIKDRPAFDSKSYELFVQVATETRLLSAVLDITGTPPYLKNKILDSRFSRKEKKLSS